MAFAYKYPACISFRSPVGFGAVAARNVADEANDCSAALRTDASNIVLPLHNRLISNSKHRSDLCLCQVTVNAGEAKMFAERARARRGRFLEAAIHRNVRKTRYNCPPTNTQQATPLPLALLSTFCRAFSIVERAGTRKLGAFPDEKICISVTEHRNLPTNSPKPPWML